jgi:hypothetical protein
MNDGPKPVAEPVSDPTVGNALVDAARQIHEIEPFSAKQTLTVLSTNTAFTGIDVFEDSIFRVKDEYSAPATIYVELNFGPVRERRKMGDSFPARVLFHMDGNRAVITDITAYTSSYFGSKEQ